MTIEELKQHCERQVKMCEEWAKGNDREPSGKIYEEHKLILNLIKALEQQPCDDCERVLNRVMEYTYGMLTVEKVGLQHFIKSMIDDLPPVTPKSQIQIKGIEPADVIERSELDKAIEEIKHLTIYHKTTQGSELVSRKAVLRTINKYLGE